MTVQQVSDRVTLVQSAGAHYSGNQADQTYFLVPELVQAGRTIVISDYGGSNRIALPAGLEITESVVASNEAMLTLSNGARVNIRGADNFTYGLGESLTPFEPGVTASYEVFAQETLGVASLPASGAVTGGSATINGDGSVSTIPPPTPVDDHGDTLATASVLQEGLISGNIEMPGDRDMFEVYLFDDRDYAFTLAGLGGNTFDPYLRFYDSNGRLLAFDDDSAGALDAELLYSPAQSGRYYVEAAAYEDLSSGGYQLDMSGQAAPAPSDGFDYTLNYTNAHAFGEYRQVIDQSISAALDYWGQYLNTAQGANIDIEVNYTPQPGNMLASAGASMSNLEDSFNGQPVYTSAVQHELQTGYDISGPARDAVINIASRDLSSNSWWYDPTPADRTDNMPGAGQIDFIGVVLHEFGHALGFTSSYEYGYGGVEHRGTAFTRFDTWIDRNPGRTEFVFTGSNAQQAYAELGGQGGVPLYVEPHQPGSSFAHYGGVDVGPLAGMLMNPAVSSGMRLDVGGLDLAILEDLGYSISMPAGAQELSAEAPGAAWLAGNASESEAWWI